MNIRKIRFIIPGIARGQTRHPRDIPNSGPIVLATIARRLVADVLVYAESISEIRFANVYDADIVFISIHTHNSLRGYEIAQQVKKNSNALVVMGGLHASLYPAEAIAYCDYILLGEADESIVEFLETLQQGREPDFPGLVFRRDGRTVHTGKRLVPMEINTVPDRNLVHGYARAAKTSDFLWPIVHASRGCPYRCSFCGVVRHFGQKMRFRSPESIIEDIKTAIAFHRRPYFPRQNKILWLTDDNFAHNREWAKSVLNAIIREKIRYNFVVQARVEIGHDQELLRLMKRAGFIDIYLGIESIVDESLGEYNKESNREKIDTAIANIQQAGIGVHGLFIFGADSDRPGIGRKVAEFVIEKKIRGVLLQSLVFIPGTAYHARMKQAGRLIHEDWSRYVGNVVHFPKLMTPSELQQEIYTASRLIYSPRRLLHALWTYPAWINRVLFVGEYIWQARERREMKREILRLRELEREAVPELCNEALQCSDI